MSNDANSVAANGDFHLASVNNFEPWFNKVAVDPVSDVLPRWVHPNHITTFSLVNCWSLGIATVVAMQLSPEWALAARIFGGMSLVCYAYMDSLDGVHARRSKQCSFKGEILDHWVDSMGVPLATGATLLVAQPDNGMMVAACVGVVLTFLAQLVVYNATHEFHAQPASGTLAQFIAGGLIMLMGVILYNVPRANLWVSIIVESVSIFSVATMLSSITTYGFKLGFGPMWRACAPCLFCCGVISFVFLSQNPSLDIWHGTMAPVFGTGVDRWMGVAPFFLLCTMFSLRFCGTYVLLSRLRRRWNGVDKLALMWALVLLGTHFFAGWATTPSCVATVLALPYVASVHLFGQCYLDLKRAFMVLDKQ